MTRTRPSGAIGYSTLGRDLTGPGDRRRFCYYAARRNLPYEIADPARRYDVVIANNASDISVWSRLAKPTKLIFDLVDSYLSVPRTDLRAMFRGPAKFAAGQLRRFHADYKRLIEATCRRADAVVCSTEEQRVQLLDLCPNVHIILDFQTEAVRKVKNDYSRGEIFHLVWEGLPENLKTFRCIADALREVGKSHPVALHLVTGIERAVGLTNVWIRPTKPLIRRILSMDAVYLYEWNLEMFATICTACDLAVVPIPLDVPFLAGKPENKLLVFWRMGIPAVTSATPAYERAMRGAGLEMTCHTQDDWVRMLERYMKDEEGRREAGRRGREYAETTCGEDTLLRKWDNVLASVLEGRRGPSGTPAANEGLPS